MPWSTPSRASRQGVRETELRELVVSCEGGPLLARDRDRLSRSVNFISSALVPAFK
jgi:hypothetical protein